eukprot:5422849-Lingulodinium_polyedra.AAC.1
MGQRTRATAHCWPASRSVGRVSRSRGALLDRARCVAGSQGPPTGQSVQNAAGSSPRRGRGSAVPS